MSYLLTHDAYTPQGIQAAVSAFSALCTATAQHHQTQSVLMITADETIIGEFLNYALASSVAELLSKRYPMARYFNTIEAYGGRPAGYQLLPFRFTRLDGEELLVNDAGEYLFCPP